VQRRAWLIVTLLAVLPACAAPIRVTVDPKGYLVVPRDTVRKLKLTKAKNGLVCVEFPKAVRPSAGVDHHGDVSAAPRIWTPLRRDGALVIAPSRVETGTGTVPGKPGLTYQGVVKKGCLVLSPVRR
jgi:hypothetical protein